MWILLLTTALALFDPASASGRDLLGKKGPKPPKGPGKPAKPSKPSKPSPPAAGGSSLYSCTPIALGYTACKEYTEKCTVTPTSSASLTTCPNGVLSGRSYNATMQQRFDLCCDMPGAVALNTGGVCQCPNAASNPIPSKLKLSYYNTREDCLARQNLVASIAPASTAQCSPTTLTLGKGVDGSATSTSPAIKFLRDQLGIQFGDSSSAPLPASVNIAFADSEGYTHRNASTSVPMFKYAFSSSACGQFAAPVRGYGALQVSVCQYVNTTMSQSLTFAPAYVAFYLLSESA